MNEPSNQNYYERELGLINPTENIVFQFRDENGTTTRWLTLNKDSVKALRNFLSKWKSSPKPNKPTRENVLRNFKVDKYGIIQTPGKFEGEMLYVPYFWGAFLDGLGVNDNKTIMFDVFERDQDEFPELIGIQKVMLNVDKNGFIHCQVNKSE